jgi:hypothetical protein
MGYRNSSTRISPTVAGFLFVISTVRLSVHNSTAETFDLAEPPAVAAQGVARIRVTL